MTAVTVGRGHRGAGRATSDWWSVSFGLSLQILAAYQHFKIPPVLPELLARYPYPPALAGGYMAVYAVIGLGASVPLGRVLAHGRHRTMIGLAAGLVVIGAGPTLLFPESGIAVLAGRGLEGAGASVLAILGPALANAAAAHRHLPLVAALTALWIPIGQLAANLIALIALPAWTVLWWVGIAAAVVIILWAAARPAVGRCPSAAVAAVPPVPRPAGLSLAVAIFTLWSTQFIAFMTWLPTYLVTVHEFDAATAVIGYSVPVALVLVFNLAGGAILRAGVAPPRLLLLSLVPQVAAWLLVSLTARPDVGLAGLIAYGAGAGLTPTALFALPAFLLGRGANTSLVFGWLMAGRNLGVLIGPMAPPLMLEASGSWTLTGLGLAASTTVTAFLALRLTRLVR